MQACCDVPRWDFVGEQPVVPPCGHQTCADDEERHHNGRDENEPWACPSGNCELAWLEAVCDLEAGHDGPHQFEERVDPALWSSGLDLGQGWPHPEPRTSAVGGGGAP